MVTRPHQLFMSGIRPRFVIQGSPTLISLSLTPQVHKSPRQSQELQWFVYSYPINFQCWYIVGLAHFGSNVAIANCYITLTPSGKNLGLVASSHTWSRHSLLTLGAVNILKKLRLLSVLQLGLWTLCFLFSDSTLLYIT